MKEHETQSRDGENASQVVIHFRICMSFSAHIFMVMCSDEECTYIFEDVVTHFSCCIFITFKAVQ